MLRVLPPQEQERVPRPDISYSKGATLHREATREARAVSGNGELMKGKVSGISGAVEPRVYNVVGTASGRVGSCIQRSPLFS